MHVSDAAGTGEIRANAAHRGLVTTAVLDRHDLNLNLDLDVVEVPAPEPVEFAFRAWGDDGWTEVGEQGLLACISTIRDGGPEVGFVRRRNEDLEFAQLALDSRRGLALEFKPATETGRFLRAWTPGLPETRVNIRVGTRGYIWWSPRCELVSLHVAVAAITLWGREPFRLLDGLALREPTAGETEFFAGVRSYW